MPRNGAAWPGVGGRVGCHSVDAQAASECLTRTPQSARRSVMRRCLLPAVHASHLVQVCADSPCSSSPLVLVRWSYPASFITDQLGSRIAFPLSPAKLANLPCGLQWRPLRKPGSGGSPRLPLPSLSRFCPAGKPCVPSPTPPPLHGGLGKLGSPE